MDVNIQYMHIFTWKFLRSLLCKGWNKWWMWFLQSMNMSSRNQTMLRKLHCTLTHAMVKKSVCCYWFKIWSWKNNLSNRALKNTIQFDTCCDCACQEKHKHVCSPVEVTFTRKGRPFSITARYMNFLYMEKLPISEVK